MLANPNQMSQVLWTADTRSNQIKTRLKCWKWSVGCSLFTRWNICIYMIILLAYRSFFFQLHKILKNKQEIGGNIWLKWNSFKKAEWQIGYIPANTLNSFINHSDNLYSHNPRSLFHSIINFKVNSPQQFQRKLKILKQVCSWSSVVKSLFTSNV